MTICQSNFDYHYIELKHNLRKSLLYRVKIF
nr:MAG TPA: hypothetical protein [Caudoviricetes sp.]